MKTSQEHRGTHTSTNGSCMARAYTELHMHGRIRIVAGDFCDSPCDKNNIWRTSSCVDSTKFSKVVKSSSILRLSAPYHLPQPFIASSGSADAQKSRGMAGMHICGRSTRTGYLFRGHALERHCHMLSSWPLYLLENVSAGEEERVKDRQAVGQPLKWVQTQVHRHKHRHNSTNTSTANIRITTIDYRLAQY